MLATFRVWADQWNAQMGTKWMVDDGRSIMQTSEISLTSVGLGMRVATASLLRGKLDCFRLVTCFLLHAYDSLVRVW